MAWKRRHGVGQVMERMVQKRGGSSYQYSQRLFEQGLPCLKSGGTDGTEGGSSYQFLPLQLAILIFSLEVLGCLSESLTLLTFWVWALFQT